MLRQILIVCLACAAIGSPAWAEEIAEARFTTDFFGTTVVLTVPEAIPMADEYGYWADQLPEKLYDPGYLTATATAALAKAGHPPLPEDFILYATPGELDAENGYAYTLSFEQVSPAVVREILAGVDNLAALLPGAQLSFTPLTTAYVYASTLEMDETLVVDYAGMQFSFTPGTKSSDMLAQLTAAFRRRYGPQTVVDSFYYSESLNADGSGMRSLNFLVDVAPAAAEASLEDEV